jgi:sterol desaturase/sphingolipid hydroxylase (fatty acid hydroxylase superfamily)
VQIPDDGQPGTSRSDLLRASPPMFNSRALDALSRVHPAVPVIIFVPAIAVLSVLALSALSVAPFLGLLLGGYLLWTLFEYWLHRLVFHFEPEAGIGARLHWIIHGVHHDHPNDPLRLVMPPAVSVPLGAAIIAVLYLAFGPHAAPALGAGFVAGYLAYDMTHYYLHHFPARGRLGRLLRELHMRHHFQDHTRGFGISAPYWDAVFGTLHRRSSHPPAEPADAGRKGAAARSTLGRSLIKGPSANGAGRSQEKKPWQHPTSTG